MTWRRFALDTHTFVAPRAAWGLAHAPRSQPRAVRVERQWRWPLLVALVATVPAFYMDLLPQASSRVAIAVYLTAALTLALATAHTALRTHDPVAHLLSSPTDLLLVAGLLAAAALPTSEHSVPALVARLAVAGLTLLRMVWTLRHLITRGGLSYLLLVALAVLLACGLGFWWLEPTTPDLASGLWLAFTTAATVGYGDLVPTTPASRIFAVFVVLLGFGVLSLVTAAIAAHWVETEERRIEREILRDMRHELGQLRQELASLRGAIHPPLGPGPRSEGQPVRLDVQKPVEDQ
jgi:voltage-gated potassium channel